MRRIFATIITVILFTVMLLSCKENATTPNDVDEISFPEIISLTSDKPTIVVGGLDPAIITCEAIGGNLEYTWETDLGEIFTVNEDGSVIRFSGSNCCEGPREIKCTVSNEKGSVTESIIITILDVEIP